MPVCFVVQPDATFLTGAPVSAELAITWRDNLDWLYAKIMDEAPPGNENNLSSVVVGHDHSGSDGKSEMGAAVHVIQNLRRGWIGETSPTSSEPVELSGNPTGVYAIPLKEARLAWGHEPPDGHVWNFGHNRVTCVFLRGALTRFLRTRVTARHVSGSQHAMLRLGVCHEKDDPLMFTQELELDSTQYADFEFCCDLFQIPSVGRRSLVDGSIRRLHWGLEASIPQGTVIQLSDSVAGQGYAALALTSF